MVDEVSIGLQIDPTTCLPADMIVYPYLCIVVRHHSHAVSIVIPDTLLTGSCVRDPVYGLVASHAVTLKPISLPDSD